MKIKIPEISAYKALLISALYITQSVPVSFIKTGFQVFLKNQGIPYDTISKLLGLLLLPWVLKFLWAPLVDGFGSRKKWIIPLQIAGALTLVGAAFLDLESQLTQVFVLFFFYSFLCATQDIAVDGLAVLSLSRKQHGLGNSMQMGGYYMGELLGGAVILVIFDQFGWTSSILTLAAFYLLPLFLLIPYKEEQQKRQHEAKKPRFRAIFDYFKKEQGVWIALLFLYMGNQILARTLLPSLLTERGFTESETGFTVGIFGNSASILGAILGGLFMEQIGRKRSLFAYGLLKIPFYFLLLLIPDTATSQGIVIGSIILNDFVSGLATVALFTVMMDKCSLLTPGTDFTVQQSINSISVLFFLVLSGIIRQSLGFTALIYAAALVGLVSLFFVWKLKLDENHAEA